MVVVGSEMVGLVLRRAATTLFVGVIMTGLMAASASAFQITDDLELVTVTSVGTAFQSVSFLNSYTTPIPVCVGHIPSNSNWTPVVRLQNVAAGGMDVRVQSLTKLELRHFTAIDAEFSETGALAAAYKQLNQNVTVGVGYNFTTFSDDLADLTFDDEGAFLNIVAAF